MNNDRVYDTFLIVLSGFVGALAAKTNLKDTISLIGTSILLMIYVYSASWVFDKFRNCKISIECKKEKK